MGRLLFAVFRALYASVGDVSRGVELHAPGSSGGVFILLIFLTLPGGHVSTVTVTVLQAPRSPTNMRLPTRLDMALLSLSCFARFLILFSLFEIVFLV